MLNNETGVMRRWKRESAPNEKVVCPERNSEAGDEIVMGWMGKGRLKWKWCKGQGVKQELYLPFVSSVSLVYIMARSNLYQLIKLGRVRGYLLYPSLSFTFLLGRVCQKCSVVALKFPLLVMFC